VTEGPWSPPIASTAIVTGRVSAKMSATQECAARERHGGSYSVSALSRLEMTFLPR
jgi:hypothetical protein